MANRNLVRRQGTILTGEVASATVIEKGDNLYLDATNGDVQPATDFTYTTSLALSQANFARDYVGVAMDKSDSGDTAKIAFASKGTIVEMDIASTTLEFGQLLGPMDTTGTPLLDQQVAALGQQSLNPGIGYVAKRYGTATTRVEMVIDPIRYRLPAPVWIHMCSGLVTTAADLVTDFTCDFPFKILKLRTITTVIINSDTVISVEKGATALDDTLTIAASGSAVGVQDDAVMNDASGDDVFDAGDTLTVKSDGGASAGEAIVQILVAPYRGEL